MMIYMIKEKRKEVGGWVLVILIGGYVRRYGANQSPEKYRPHVFSLVSVITPL